MSYTFGDTRLPRRFWDKVKIVDCALRPELGPCWEWTACLNKAGYGKLVIGSRTDKSRKSVLAHRFAYENLIGPFTKGLESDHLCHNTACVNPAHIEPVTSLENQHRSKHNNGRSARNHCPQGHPYDGKNTSIGTKGERRCRTCIRERSRIRYYTRNGRERATEWRRKHGIYPRNK